MYLFIDNYDSFVYNLVRYIQELGEEVFVYKNDEITVSEIIKLNPKGIIISPGPKSPEDTGVCLDIVEKLSGKIPILGICLGHQVIAQSFGGKVIKNHFPVHGKVSEVYHKNLGVLKSIQVPFNVTRYHSLIVDKKTLPDCLEITCETEDGTIMGIKHKKFKVEGLQFHPEAELTEFGHNILANFISY